MKIIIIAIVFLLSIIKAYTQKNWPPVGAKWYYSFSPCSMVYCPDIDEFIYFEATKDTVINDTVCKKIIIEYHKINDEIKYMGDEYIFSTEDSVYTFHHGHFYLLYDFSAQIGDTLTLFLSSNSNLYSQLEEDFEFYPPVYVKHKVNERDSININGKNYLYIALNHFEVVGEPSLWYQYFKGGKIVKNIGSFNFLLGDIEGAIEETSYYGPLRCYSDSFITYTTGIPCDTLITSVEQDYQNTEVKVFPNPVNNNVLQFDFGSNTIGHIEIYDYKGILMDLISVNNQPLFMYSTEKYRPGIYFYLASNQKGLKYTGKFVVQ